MNSDTLKNLLPEKIFNLNSEKKVVAILALGIIGAFLILFSDSLFGAGENTSIDESETLLTSSEYKKMLEENLETTLSSVEGVGNIKVMITLEGEVDKEIAYNETTTQNTSSGTSSSSNESTSKDAVMTNVGGESTPFTIEDKYPSVVGAIVVCSGANNTTIKYYITESIMATLDIPSHKVMVLPMEENTSY